MPSLLVIRLHPVDPITGDDFTTHLNGLAIDAHEISFADPAGDGAAFGTAEYIAPTLPPSPGPNPQPQQDPDTRIVQHFGLTALPFNVWQRDFFATATAVIEIPDPPAGAEFRTADVRLVIRRGVNETLHKQIYYNVPVAPAPLPGDPNAFSGLSPSLHLALTPPTQAGGATLLPDDGTAPNFAALRAAVEDVLNAEPGNLDDIADLSRVQARHIAHEIIWDRLAHPLPQPAGSFDAIYTGPQDAGSDEERDRRIFEGDLLTYYTKHEAEADRLANFVFSLSAAIWCERRSETESRVGFYFPVLPGSPSREAKVILTGVGGTTVDPAFTVPAEYFYALTAILPSQVGREQRYQMVQIASEAQTVTNLETAIEDDVLTEPAGVNRFQAARRLRALGLVGDVGTPEFEVVPASDAHGLVTHWLARIEADIAPFWNALVPADVAGHLDLVLCAVTQNHTPLIAAIHQPAFAVDDAADLTAKANQDWEALLTPDPGLLPEFTRPGTTAERIQAFIRHLRKFFEVPNVFDAPVAPAPAPVPALARPANPLDALLANYPDPPGFTFDGWNPALLAATLNGIFPGDPVAQQQFTAWLECIRNLMALTAGIAPDEVRFSVLEALWARGLTSPQVIARFTQDEFQEALTGSVAYDFAATIWGNAQVPAPQPEPDPGNFAPVNPGTLVNCIPPLHRSPLGPVAYLNELLRASPQSTCAQPLPAVQPTLATLLAGRRGPVGDLAATKANQDLPLPLIDLVNESLEHMVASGETNGAVFDTARDQVDGHVLTTHPAPPADAVLHDPEILLEALPEHSTPFVPTESQGAYEVLRNDFSTCTLPYHQPLDVSRSYLRQLGTRRYTAMRHFRREITEFVIDPTRETAEFQRHLWRYPVRLDTAIEYLCLSPEEFNTLFQPEVPRGRRRRAANAVPRPALHTLFGFTEEIAADGEGPHWTETVLQLDEFLARTCLSYCEFIELWRSEFVEFGPPGRVVGGTMVAGTYPDCEPCCLSHYRIEIDGGRAEILAALSRLFVFIRLWRKLQCIANARYTFTELRDICEVLQLFVNGNVNPDFIRQLAAFQMLRDDFKLALTDDSTAPANATGADRTHLLAFWVPGAAHWNWAVTHLLEHIQQYAIDAHHCGCRDPEFLKLLADNLAALSALSGFDPDNPTDTWHALPTHTLRFAEILAKIYASEFGVGELLFLFTSQPHLRGDDPLPLQTDNETGDSSFGLPDDDVENSLHELRRKLLAVDVPAESAQQWTWARMDMALRTEFGFVPSPAGDAWLAIGQHFFPGVIVEATGAPVALAQRQYRVPLAATSELMWNTPLDGPFRFDAAAAELWTQIPLTDEAVLAKLGRIRQLTAPEQVAVRELYFRPRADLARFAFIFDNFREAEELLIQEPDEARRWQWFQREFARFHRRCELIAEHLAAHVDNVTCTPEADGLLKSKLLLEHLWGDENRATTPWEDDSGASPANMTWQPKPNGGAYAALLGLRGTGLLAEYFDAGGTLRWRELRGGLCAFGPEENSWCAPIPAVLPMMGFSLTPAQLRFAAIRNGFAITNDDGEMIGGCEPYTLRWSGLLLIEEGGEYAFAGGAPSRTEKPDFDAIAKSHRWRVRLRRGQKSWVLLAHDWPGEEAPAHCTDGICLKKGFYEITIELERKPLVLDDDVCRQLTGFDLRYLGKDSGDKWLTVQYDKLFVAQKDGPLGLGTDLLAPAQNEFLASHYSSSVRDIRRTYQRAFKALLFANRLHLSARPESDDGDSELGYMLSQPDHFAGQSYYRAGNDFVTHRANFDFNLLPVFDNYGPPSVAQDQRVAPTAQRRQALFDWWERMFDYTVMRLESRASPEQPTWLLFHEASETHVDNPAHLLRHLGVDLRHDTLVLEYFDASAADLSYDVTSEDLEDDRWAVRLWHAEKWVRRLLHRFHPLDITFAEVHLWVSDGPTLEGNANLTRFLRDGCIGNGDPRRYLDIKLLNDGLRERGRQALIAWLTHQDRVALPWGGFATSARDLTELLLLDVEAGLCQKASRIEEAASAIQHFVQRARLGLESGFVPTTAFMQAWDSRFANYRLWKNCRQREIYRENWIEWDELAAARKTEAFQFLESELRRATLTVPVPGGLAYWQGPRPPAHPGIKLLQHREPAVIELLDRPVEGLGLLGTPDRHARPSWLAPVRMEAGRPDPGNPDDPDIPDVPGTPANPNNPDGTPAVPAMLPATPTANLPLWLQAAMRLGTRFIRVAAAGIPPATTNFEPKCQPGESSVCCCVCGKDHPALMDEYYFWIEDAHQYLAREQVAEWGATAADPQSDWHRAETLPALLDWQAQPTVHLRWCRVHNGEFQQPRRSNDGVHVAAGAEPVLVFTGRSGDSLTFTITNGVSVPGFLPPPPPGFRYDLAPDDAIVVPTVVAPPATPLVGGLAAFPFFAWFDPGAPVLPLTMFSPAVSVAGHLRAHCRFETALKWYELIYNPLLHDNTWSECVDEEDDDVRDPIPGAAPASNVPVPRDPLECCCPSDPVPATEQRQRAILLHYLETLLQWGDAVLRKNTPEYFQQARLLFDTAHRILGPTPPSVAGDDEPPPPAVGAFEPDCAPVNPRLLCLYTAIDDRLALIHACLNARRLKNGKPNPDMPYFGNSDTRECWKSTPEACTDESDWCLPQSCYRFQVLIGKAQELAMEVRGLGAALLAAYEKGDAEYLANMRAMHERQLLDLALEVRQLQWRDADWQVQALRKTKEIAQTRLQYFNTLIANGLIDGEVQYEPLTIASSTVRTAGNVMVAIGQFLNLIPDPFVGFPSNFIKLPPGTKLSNMSSAGGTIANTVAEIINTAAGLGLTKAGWDRREDEWQHQVDVLTVEIEQIERQILGAERRRDAALRELNMQRRQIENAAEVATFLRDKFSGHDLYLWLQHETAALYYRMYELALHTARQAQRAFNYERGHTARSFVPSDTWDNLHEGLLAGERLQLAVKQMDKAYIDENCREYELTKHVSLRLHAPDAFLKLKLTGRCELELPEWLFDLDYPGHYMRRIRNLSVTIPCVVGPYTGVHCRMTLLSSSTRVDPRLTSEMRGCCDSEPLCHCPGNELNGYAPVACDARIVKQYAATEAIATSTGQRDGGVFELNFRDERYLPFEFAGAVSRWRIELPPENNRFELDGVTDFIVHLNFTAREGGENLRKAANKIAQKHLPGDGVRMFDMKQELPDAWRWFAEDCDTDRKVRLKLSQNMFPFLPGHRDLSITRIGLLFEAPCATPSTHHEVKFVLNDDKHYLKGDWDCCAMQDIVCIASAEWPCTYYGVLQQSFDPLCADETRELGTLIMPRDVSRVARAWLVCEYEASPARPCRLDKKTVAETCCTPC